MMRKLNVEIWGVTDGTPNPASITVSTDDGERVKIDAAQRPVIIEASYLIALARMLESMRPASKHGGG